MERPDFVIGTPGVLTIPAVSSQGDIQAPAEAREVCVLSTSPAWGLSVTWQSVSFVYVTGAGPGPIFGNAECWAPLPTDGCSRRMLSIENQAGAAAQFLVMWR